jgi:hypothetical protein
MEPAGALVDDEDGVFFGPVTDAERRYLDSLAVKDAPPSALDAPTAAQAAQLEAASTVAAATEPACVAGAPHEGPDTDHSSTVAIELRKESASPTAHGEMRAIGEHRLARSALSRAVRAAEDACMSPASVDEAVFMETPTIPTDTPAPEPCTQVAEDVTGVDDEDAQEFDKENCAPDAQPPPLPVDQDLLSAFRASTGDARALR